MRRKTKSRAEPRIDAIPEIDIAARADLPMAGAPRQLAISIKPQGPSGGRDERLSLAQGRAADGYKKGMASLSCNGGQAEPLPFKATSGRKAGFPTWRLQ